MIQAVWRQVVVAFSKVISAPSVSKPVVVV